MPRPGSVPQTKYMRTVDSFEDRFRMMQHVAVMGIDYIPALFCLALQGFLRFPRFGSTFWSVLPGFHKLPQGCTRFSRNWLYNLVFAVSAMGQQRVRSQAIVQHGMKHLRKRDRE